MAQRKTSLSSGIIENGNLVMEWAKWVLSGLTGLNAYLSVFMSWWRNRPNGSKES